MISANRTLKVFLLIKCIYLFLLIYLLIFYEFIFNLFIFLKIPLNIRFGKKLFKSDYPSLKQMRNSDSTPSKTPLLHVHTCSVRCPFTRSFTIGNGSGQSFTDLTVDDRNEKVTRQKQRNQLSRKTVTIFVKKKRNSRSATYATPFPHDSGLVTRSVRE